jgi:hypothetical protein
VIQYEVSHRVADLAAMVDLQSAAPKVHLDAVQGDVQGGVPVGHCLRLDAVQSVDGVVARAQAPDASRALVPVQLGAVHCASVQAYCLRRERCVAHVHSFRDPDVRHAVDPVTPAFRDEARSGSVLQVPDDLLHRLVALQLPELPPY